MKKIGILILTLVFALGAVGVGYAMWSDTISISGTVKTGSLDLDITGVSSSYVYKVINLGYGTHQIGEAIYYWDDAYSPDFLTEGLALNQDADPENELLLVSSAVTTCNAGEAVETVTMTLNNIFPTPIDGNGNGYGAYTVADLRLVYLGSIPAHVYMSAPVWNCEPNPFAKYIKFDWEYPEGTSVNPATLQLHGNEWIYLYVYLDGSLLQADGVDAMSLGPCTFSFTLTAYQWNETYPPGDS